MAQPPKRPRWPAAPMHRAGLDTRRWMVVLVVLAGSLGVYAIERWMRPPEAPVTGRAMVADGDTLTIAGIRIRLIDIDAPELEQTCRDPGGEEWPCGRHASGELRSHIRGRDLTCRPKGRDRYNRVLATCALPDGSDVNAWMVREGWATVSGAANVYGAQEAEARAARRGIWSGRFTPPRDWRRQHPRLDVSDN